MAYVSQPDDAKDESTAFETARRIHDAYERLERARIRAKHTGAVGGSD